MSDAKRREVIIGEQEAAAWIRDGMTVSIGGFLNSSHPMPLVRAIIRNGIKNLTLVEVVTVEGDRADKKPRGNEQDGPKEARPLHFRSAAKPASTSVPLNRLAPSVATTRALPASPAAAYDCASRRAA